MTNILNLRQAQLRLPRIRSHVMITEALKHRAKVSEKLRLGGSMYQHVVNIQLTDAVDESYKDLTRHTALKIGPSSL